MMTDWTMSSSRCSNLAFLRLCLPTFVKFCIFAFVLVSSNAYDDDAINAYDDDAMDDTVLNPSDSRSNNWNRANSEIYFDGIPNNSSVAACDYNTNLMSYMLQNNISYSTLIVPSNTVFYFRTGIFARNLRNAILQIDGTMRFQKMSDYDPKKQLACFKFDRSNNVTITSKYATSQNNYRGLMDGQGSQYWRLPGLGYIKYGENRPRLLRIERTTGLLIENMVFQDSPYHTVSLVEVRNVEIKNISIVARRTKKYEHSTIDLTAFNTDGIDVSGSNVHVHDIDVWTQDDCIAVKSNPYTWISKDMLFENINASGLGFAIGGISNSTVSNITFRNSYLHKPVKGLYMKFTKAKGGGGGGTIKDIVYDNITVYRPIQWSIWIGPAQQSNTSDPCYPNPCSLCWPQSSRAQCNVVEQSNFANISLSNIKIVQPKMSPGVIMGASSASDGDVGISRIDGLKFHNVQVLKTGQPATKDLTIAFPGLKQPVNDHFVTRRKILKHFFSYHVIVPFFHLWAALRRPGKWDDRKKYYRCNGVANGIATGNTSPLPACLQDLTD